MRARRAANAATEEKDQAELAWCPALAVCISVRSQPASTALLLCMWPLSEQDLEGPNK